MIYSLRARQALSRDYRDCGFRTPRLFVHQAAVCAAFALALSIQHFDIESHESIKPAGSSYHCLKLAIASSRFTLRWQGAQVCAILILGIIFRYYQIILNGAHNGSVTAPCHAVFSELCAHLFQAILAQLLARQRILRIIIRIARV